MVSLLPYSTYDEEGMDGELDGAAELFREDIKQEESMTYTQEELESLLSEYGQVVEQEVRQEYTASPVYRGLLGLCARFFGLAPDSTGKPSGSWTLYLLAHIPILILTCAIAYSLVFSSVTTKVLSAIPVWLVLAPMFLAWTSWVIHHKKLVDVLVQILHAAVQAIAAVKGKLNWNVLGGTVSSLSQTDPKLKAGAKQPVTKLTLGATPKTDPATLPTQPQLE